MEHIYDRLLAVIAKLLERNDEDAKHLMWVLTSMQSPVEWLEKAIEMVEEMN